MKKIALSMSGGGIKSIIYLGVYKYLIDAGYDVYSMGGLSGGSLLSGALAVGKDMMEIKKVVKEIGFWQMVGFKLKVDSRNGRITRLEKFLREYLGEVNIEDLEKNIVVLATNIDERRAEVFTEGDLVSAIMASISIPPVFPPYKYGNSRFIDGGFSVFYGADYFREQGADLVIGCDVDGFTNTGFPGFIDGVYQGISCLCSTVENYEKKYMPVDLVINDFKDDTKMFTMKRDYDYLIEVGYRRCCEMADEIKRALEVK